MYRRGVMSDTKKSNGIGICSWDEWKNKLNEEQRQYELHRILLMLDNRTRNMEKCLAPRQTKNSIYSFLGGLVGGFIAVATYIGLMGPWK